MSICIYLVKRILFFSFSGCNGIELFSWEPNIRFSLIT